MQKMNSDSRKSATTGTAQSHTAIHMRAVTFSLNRQEFYEWRINPKNLISSDFKFFSRSELEQYQMTTDCACGKRGFILKFIESETNRAKKEG
jgi:hypothetical protein